jgi:hypothetical protein
MDDSTPGVSDVLAVVETFLYALLQIAQILGTSELPNSLTTLIEPLHQERHPGCSSLLLARIRQRCIVSAVGG